MSFEMRPNEPLNDGIKRIANARIEDSIDRLRRFEQTPDKSVHEFRKNMKKIRAVLRLVRHGIPDNLCLQVRYRGDFLKIELCSDHVEVASLRAGSHPIRAGAHRKSR